MDKDGEILLDGIRRALGRFDHPGEPHNLVGGYPRSALGWAMAQDLKETLEKLSLTNNK